MGSEKSSSSSSGIGIFGLAFLIFMTLKLCAIEPVASWSWWWVTAPLWGGFAFLVIFLGGAFICVLLFHLWEEAKREKTWRHPK